MMKRIIFTLSLLTPLAIFASDPPLSCEPEKEAVAVENFDSDLISKAVGHMIAKQLKNPGFEFNLEKMIEGMREVAEGKPAPMTEIELQQALAAIQEKVFLQMAENNLAEANAFLKENSAKQEVVSIDEHLQYTITKEGVGNEVKETSTPLIHYTGKLLDGTVFASSLDGEKPVALPLTQSIPGFSKGLLGMKEGEKRTLFIHPELAYGISGNLPPNVLLIFDVEIVKAEDEASIAKESEN